eukprot:CAMPEP_0177758384 /NCGR_PEP_ID=MMETSP0491_2-20121128/4154_1 /TAXON_ID=63592 /ORGANISM="Tetraselmis chuii, Strain PLY429" /LENGTH=345 /DNA_ID=CAMNT_0019274111 /DNA_START=286 /DNA_END=1325 /DNA_ORIENTATION=-
MECSSRHNNNTAGKFYGASERAVHEAADHLDALHQRQRATKNEEDDDEPCDVGVVPVVVLVAQEGEKVLEAREAAVQDGHPVVDVEVDAHSFVHLHQTVVRLALHPLRHAHDGVHQVERLRLHKDISRQTVQVLVADGAAARSRELFRDEARHARDLLNLLLVQQQLCGLRERAAQRQFGLHTRRATADGYYVILYRGLLMVGEVYENWSHVASRAFTELISTGATSDRSTSISSATVVHQNTTTPKSKKNMSPGRRALPLSRPPLTAPSSELTCSTSGASAGNLRNPCAPTRGSPRSTAASFTRSSRSAMQNIRISRCALLSSASDCVSDPWRLDSQDQVEQKE